MLSSRSTVSSTRRQRSEAAIDQAPEGWPAGLRPGHQIRAAQNGRPEAVNDFRVFSRMGLLHARYCRIEFAESAPTLSTNRTTGRPHIPRRTARPSLLRQLNSSTPSVCALGVLFVARQCLNCLLLEIIGRVAVRPHRSLTQKRRRAGRMQRRYRALLSLQKIVADGRGLDPAVRLPSYCQADKKANTSATAVVGALSRGCARKLKPESIIVSTKMRY
jgi:hypothetical protein